MTTEQVIGCAPFRLAGPRDLTPFEWSVVRTAILDGFSRAGSFVAAPDTQAAAAALVGAIQQNQGCPTWRQSAFGPAPAVAPLPYECLGEWFARLDYNSRLRALGDIQRGGLLCAPNPPWAACGTDQRRAASGWEGAPQLGVVLPGIPLEPCADPRQRTSYVPMTIEELVGMFRKLGGQVPPALEQGYSALPPEARARTVLLGVQLKPATPELGVVLAGAQDMMAIALALIEEVAIVWAPGKGTSLTSMLVGNVNPGLLLEMATAMLPEILAGGIQLPGGLALPAIPGLPDLTTIMGTLGGLFGTSRLLLAPRGLHGFGGGPEPTSSATGVKIVDTQGSALDRSDPFAVVRSGLTIAGAVVLVGLVGLGGWIVWNMATGRERRLFPNRAYR